ncbi:MAG: hypothetical protein KDK99_13855 [Verrucomicrobiales bacterium]|nr:hypothetical protein [Verrucomicrobiales bacterium]
MFCPSCQQAVAEASEVCPACQFSLARADAVFGSQGLVKEGVHDASRLLTRGQRRRLEERLGAFQARFPEISPSLLLEVCPANAARHARPYLFWLFNRGNLCGPMERGGKNQRFILWLDPESGALRLMLGYGLEPWLPEEELRAALQAGERAAAEGRWDGAFSAVLDELDEVFSRSALALPQMLGLVPELRWTDIVDPDVEALLTVPKRPGLVF